MGNFVISIFILALILALIVTASTIITRTCDDIAAALANGDDERAIMLWYDKSDFISIFVHDTKIDAVDAECELLDSLDTDEQTKAITRLKFAEAVEELKHSELPTPENIL